MAHINAMKLDSEPSKQENSLAHAQGSYDRDDVPLK